MPNITQAPLSCRQPARLSSRSSDKIRDLHPPRGQSMTRLRGERTCCTSSPPPSAVVAVSPKESCPRLTIAKAVWPAKGLLGAASLGATCRTCLTM